MFAKGLVTVPKIAVDEMALDLATRYRIPLPVDSQALAGIEVHLRGVQDTVDPASAAGDFSYIVDWIGWDLGGKPLMERRPGYELYRENASELGVNVETACPAANDSTSFVSFYIPAGDPLSADYLQTVRPTLGYGKSANMLELEIGAAADCFADGTPSYDELYVTVIMHHVPVTPALLSRPDIGRICVCRTFDHFLSETATDNRETFSEEGAIFKRAHLFAYNDSKVPADDSVAEVGFRFSNGGGEIIEKASWTILRARTSPLVGLDASLLDTGAAVCMVSPPKGKGSPVVLGAANPVELDYDATVGHYLGVNRVLYYNAAAKLGRR